MPNKFTIDRRPGVAFFPSLPVPAGQPTYERTIVGVTGLTHVDRTRAGRDGNFTNEGQYRHAIEDAVEENGG